MIWFVAIRNGGSRNVEHCVIGKETVLRSPRVYFEWVFMVMTVGVE